MRTSSQSILNGTDCLTATSIVQLAITRTTGKTGLSCSGTMIATDSVLTAAHCLKDAVSVTVNGAMRAASFQYIPSFNPDFSVPSPDVGVVLLGRTTTLHTVPLLARNAVVGEQGVIAGYGLDANQTSDVLRAGTVTISGLPPSGYTILSIYTPATATAGTCSGDSGGPLLVKQGTEWGIAGVISAGSDATCNASSGYTSQYARINNSQISTFIQQYVPSAVWK